MSTVSQKIRRVGPGLPVMALGVLAACAFGAYAIQASRHHRHEHPPLKVSPASRSIDGGHDARYHISLAGRLAAPGAKLRVRGLPAYAWARIRFRSRSCSRAPLTIGTSSLTPPGDYGMRLTGSRGRFHANARLALKISTPDNVSFGISGDVTDLQPGAPQAIDLTLTNRQAEPIAITQLSVAVHTVTSPNSSSWLPCTFSDFSVQQFSGPYPLVLPPRSTSTLSSLWVAPAQRPQVLLVDRPVDQDGCQRATIQLSYGGKATSK